MQSPPGRDPAYDLKKTSQVRLGPRPTGRADDERNAPLDGGAEGRLQIALNLSEMPAETLRQFASGLLEITY